VLAATKTEKVKRNKKLANKKTRRIFLILFSTIFMCQKLQKLFLYFNILYIPLARNKKIKTGNKPAFKSVLYFSFKLSDLALVFRLYLCVCKQA
jgi:hypothetical protein